jgi:glycosyltransferase involved in cell wall biosynthesis
MAPELARKRRMALAVTGRAAPAPRDPTGETARRGYLFDELFVTKYTESILDGRSSGPLERPLPGWARLAAELRRRSDEYDVIVTWSERVSLALMALDHLTGSRRPHVAMMYWFSRPSVRWPMRAFASSLHAIVTWSSVQRQYAIERLGVSPDRIYLVKHFVDQLFWSPREAETDMISSAGAEMRDYPTLLAALRGTDIRCHVATDHARVDQFGFARRVNAERFAELAPSNVTVGRKSPTDLREVYARSRFVVVPLRASDTDNGITVILEAMAMGKPVICSRTQGQVDVIQEGKTGFLVPVGDATALRNAMVSLWNEPDRARAMGMAAREYVERHHTLEKFCRDVKLAVDASLDGRAARVDGSLAEPCV